MTLNKNNNDDPLLVAEPEINNKSSSTSLWTKQNVALGVIGTSFLGTILLITPFITMQLKSPLPYMSTPRRKVLAALEEIASRRRGYNNTNKQINANAGSSSTTEPKLKYYDLGSGDGETVLAAASTGLWKATGIELNFTLYALSSLRRQLLLFSTSRGSSKPLSSSLSSTTTTSTTTINNESKSIYNSRQYSKFIWGDMWSSSSSLYDADAVMIFGVKPLMPKIAEKVEKECPPGCFLMSYRFHVPLLKQQQQQQQQYDQLHQADNDDTFHNTHDTEEEEFLGLNAELIYDVEEMRIYQLRNKT